MKFDNLNSPENVVLIFLTVAFLLYFFNILIIAIL
nr:MAG TPA: hypothetical protein [Caudoviricetes sp.]DAX61734.1 MAG TPA: hypothetical protein [Caudoviricetes sp.]